MERPVSHVRPLADTPLRAAPAGGLPAPGARGTTRAMPACGWTVYIVRCRDGSLYVGVTNALAARLAAHNAGRGAKYTRSRRPERVE